MSLRTLYQSLLDTYLTRQRVIARLWGIPLTATRRADAAAELAARMASSEIVSRVCEALPAQAEAALQDLQRHGGAMGWAAFTRRWGEIRIVGPGRLEREALWESPISPAETLWYHGFLYRTTRIDEQGVSHEVAYIPPDLMLYLPPPPPLDLPPLPTVSPPSEVIHTEDRAADYLAILWGEAQQTLLPTRGGKLPSHILQRLVRRLRLPPSQVNMLIHLSLERGWLTLDPQQRLRPASMQALEWLRKRQAQQWLELFSAWRNSKRWNDLAAIPTLQPPEGGRWPNDPVETREAMLTLLEPLTPGLWYNLSAFIAYVHEHIPDFLRPDGDYERWAIRSRGTGAILRGFEHWYDVEGALIAHMLLFPLSTLGIVATGSRWEGVAPDRFQITEAGSRLLQGEAPQLPSPPCLKIREDGEITLPPGRRYELFQVHRIADWQRDDPYTYRLSPASLGRARQQRISLERILSFLEEGSGHPLPAPLKKALERAYQRGGEVRLRHSWLVQSKEESLLQAPTLRHLLQERIGRHVALLDERHLPRVRQAIVRAGLLPDIKEEG